MALAKVAESERNFPCRPAKINVVTNVVPTAADILFRRPATTCGCEIDDRHHSPSFASDNMPNDASKEGTKQLTELSIQSNKHAIDTVLLARP